MRCHERVLCLLCIELHRRCLLVTAHHFLDREAPLLIRCNRTVVELAGDTTNNIHVVVQYVVPSQSARLAAQLRAVNHCLHRTVAVQIEQQLVFEVDVRTAASICSRQADVARSVTQIVRRVRQIPPVHLVPQSSIVRCDIADSVSCSCRRGTICHRILCINDLDDLLVCVEVCVGSEEQ